MTSKINLFCLLVVLLCTLTEVYSQTINIKFHIKDENLDVKATPIINGSKAAVTNNIYEFYLEDTTKFEISITQSNYKPFNRSFEVTKDTIFDIQLEFDSDILDGSEASRTITQEDIINTGRTNLSEALHFLVASFNSVPQNIADGTDHIMPISLRGSGTDQVLILINGKRKHLASLLNVNNTVGRGSVSNDLNNIPIASIEKVQILLSSASVEFGSDAIAGVINIITKKDISSKSYIGVNCGMALGGYGKGKNIFESIFKREYPIKFDGQTYRINGSINSKIGKEGFLSVSGEIVHQGSYNRSGSYNGNVYSKDAIIDNTLIEKYGFWDNSKPYDNKRVVRMGRALTDDANLLYNFNLPIGEENSSASIYSFGSIGYRKGEATALYRFPIIKEQIADPDKDTVGFSPKINTNIRDQYVVFGLKKVIKSKWTTDISYSLGSNSMSFNVDDTNNATMGKNSPSKAYAGTLQYKLNTFNFTVNGAINKKVGVKAGIEHRTEQYQIFAGEKASYIQDTFYKKGEIKIAGTQGFPGFRDVDEVNQSRRNLGAYISGSLKPIEQLQFNIGGRAENYSDFGNGYIWKAAFKWQLPKKINLIGSYNKGFRAPSLQQSYFSNFSSQFSNNEFKRILTVNRQSSISKALKLPDLEPEKSHNFNLGIGYENENWKVLINGYYTRVNDRIVFSDQFKTSYIQNLLKDIPTQPTATQFFLNAVQTRNLGLEGVIGCKSGKFSFNTNFHWAIKTIAEPNPKDENLAKAHEDISKNLDVVFSKVEKWRLENSAPQFKIINYITYNISNTWNITVSPNIFGRIRYIGDVSATDDTLKTRCTVDLRLGMNIKNNFLLNFGFNNILNTFPSEQNPINTTNNTFIYSRRVSQIPLMGRYVYAELRYTF